MLIALFALLLLSVVGLGMMYSTNMETNINSNYRDKQTAIYGALGGLQEARDRIRPFATTQPMPNGRIIPPAALPTLANGGVVYIINPKGGETVAPWILSNTYMDAELCHEGILSLSGPAGPCTTLPEAAGIYLYPALSAGFWQSGAFNS
jgi:Tfp pilus assembly protein PilX